MFFRFAGMLWRENEALRAELHTAREALAERCEKAEKAREIIRLCADALDRLEPPPAA